MYNVDCVYIKILKQIIALIYRYFLSNSKSVQLKIIYNHNYLLIISITFGDDLVGLGSKHHMSLNLSTSYAQLKDTGTYKKRVYYLVHHPCFSTIHGLLDYSTNSQSPLRPHQDAHNRQETLHPPKRYNIFLIKNTSPT